MYTQVRVIRNYNNYVACTEEWSKKSILSWEYLPLEYIVAMVLVYTYWRCTRRRNDRAEWSAYAIDYYCNVKVCDFTSSNPRRTTHGHAVLQQHKCKHDVYLFIYFFFTFSARLSCKNPLVSIRGAYDPTVSTVGCRGRFDRNARNDCCCNDSATIITDD
jgi:hypothetical protein